MSEFNKIIDNLKKLPDIRKELAFLSGDKYRQTEKIVSILNIADKEQSDVLYKSYKDFDDKRNNRIIKLKSFVEKTEKDSFNFAVSLSKKNEFKQAKEIMKNIEYFASEKFNDHSLKSKIDAEIAKVKRKERIVVSVATVIFLIAFVLTLLTYIIPEIDYRNAKEAIINNNYLPLNLF